MSDRGGRRFRRPIGLVAIAALAAGALLTTGSALGGSGQSCGTVVINEQSWAGSTANTYVAKYVLEKRLKCKVKLTQVTEGPPYFQAMRDSGAPWRRSNCSSSGPWSIPSVRASVRM